MAYNSDWKTDLDLRGDMARYVAQNMKRTELLDFLKRDFPQYSWSLPTLDRRLRHFEIYYIDYNTPLAVVEDAVKKELEGPGKLLGYRALNQKLRTEHDVQVPRHLVYNVVGDLDPEGLENRNVRKKQKRPKMEFTSKGPLWLVSLDGHDKLCGYQNWTFPLGVYGCLDTFSRKVLYIHVVNSNSDPLVIGKKYLEYLCETEILPINLRIDRGTETGKMTTLHAYLINQYGIMDDATESVIFGPSTTNKIERWWRDLHERLEKFFKRQLAELLQGREYDPSNILERQLLGYVYIPVVQRECDIFVSYWNSHRIREQANLELPTGVPEHMFSFPELYGGVGMGLKLTKEQLQDAAEVSELHCINSLSFISGRIRQQCEQVLPHPEKIDSKNAIEAYRFLKSHVN